MNQNLYNDLKNKQLWIMKGVAAPGLLCLG